MEFVTVCFQSIGPVEFADVMPNWDSIRELRRVPDCHGFICFPTDFAFGGYGTGASGLGRVADSNYTFGGWHAGVCHIAFADGSVHKIANDTDVVVLGQLADRADQ